MGFKTKKTTFKIVREDGAENSCEISTGKTTVELDKEDIEIIIEALGNFRHVDPSASHIRHNLSFLLKKEIDEDLKKLKKLLGIKNGVK